MSMTIYPTINDLVERARQRVPRFAFDFVDGGAGDDAGIKRNRDALDRILLMPRYLSGLNMNALDLKTTLFGRSYAYPLGIAPTGMAHLAWEGADLILAKLAKEADIPIVVSTMASTSVEKFAEVSENNTWFQLYVMNEERVNADLLARAWAVGVRVLVLTVDVPIAAERNRNVRNSVARLPIRLTPRFLFHLMQHPAWLKARLTGGTLEMANLAPYCGHGMSNPVLSKVQALTKFDVSWDDAKKIRDMWKGKLVIKGVLNPQDARQAEEMGADGIWISNHGGRQLESAPAAIDCMKPVREAVNAGMALFFDSGVRNGADVIKAKSLGAQAAFMGRALLYGIMAGGEDGGRWALNLMINDLKKTMLQVGARSTNSLDGPLTC